MPKADAVTVLAAILDEWREDLRYRVSRVKARLKFMVDDIGPEGVRERDRARLGRTFDDFELPPLPPAATTSVCTSSPTALLRRVPVHLGLITGDQMIALANLAEDDRRRRRLTRQQNFVLAKVPTDRWTWSRRRWPRSVCRSMRAASRRSDRVHRRAALQLLGHRDEVADGRPRAAAREAVRQEADSLRMHLDGCPHACAQHWVGDLGFQGTTVRDAEGKRQQAYDVYLAGASIAPQRSRGRLPPRADRGARRRRRRPGRRVGRRRGEGETFRVFCDRTRDEELGGSPAESRRSQEPKEAHEC